MKFIPICLLVVLTLEYGCCIAQDNPTKSEDLANTENKINKNGTSPGNSENQPENKQTNVPSTPNPVNNTKDNVTKTVDVGLFQKLKNNKEMLTRTFYVMLGVTSIVVIYFVVRAWRSRRRQNKSRKYGLLASSGADLEMEPLDRDVDDDDEMTMFERQK